MFTFLLLKMTFIQVVKFPFGQEVRRRLRGLVGGVESSTWSMDWPILTIPGVGSFMHVSGGGIPQKMSPNCPQRVAAMTPIYARNASALMPKWWSFAPPV